MAVKTHQRISEHLCGRLIRLEGDRAEVELLITPEMAVDDRGLVHGGFVFGCADYAAMVAVNHPWVVLAAADSRFLKPARVGDRLLALAVSDGDARRPRVNVEVIRGDEVVASFVMKCAVLERHVLEATNG